MIAARPSGASLTLKGFALHNLPGTTRNVFGHVVRTPAQALAFLREEKAIVSAGLFGSIAAWRVRKSVDVLRTTDVSAVEEWLKLWWKELGQ